MGKTKWQKEPPKGQKFCWAVLVGGRKPIIIQPAWENASDFKAFAEIERPEYTKGDENDKHR